MNKPQELTRLKVNEGDTLTVYRTEHGKRKQLYYKEFDEAGDLVVSFEPFKKEQEND